MTNEEFQEFVLSALKDLKADQDRVESEVQEDCNERIFSALERIEAKIDVLQMEAVHVRRSGRLRQVFENLNAGNPEEEKREDK